MHALTSDQIEQFETDGYLLVPGLLSDHVALLRADGHAVIERLQAGGEADGSWDAAGLVDGAPAHGQLLHCHDLEFHAASFGRVMSDAGLVDVVADLLGTPDVQLHHNKFFIKPPATGAPFPLHQDWPFFPHVDDSLLAAIVHLDDATEDKGCVRIMPGSHKMGRLDHVDGKQWYLPIDDYPVERAVAVPAKAGDVLFFGCLTIHGSGVNTSSEDRTTWLIEFRDPADVSEVDRHRSPGQGRMLRGHNASANEPPPSTL